MRRHASGASTAGSRVRVLHLISDAGPHPYFKLIGAHTDHGRFDVRIATVGPVGALHHDVERFGLRPSSLDAAGRGGYPRAVFALACRLRRAGVDVLQTHLLDASVVGLLAGRLARTPATIFTGHHSHEIPLQRRCGLTMVDRMCAGPLCDAVIAPSAQMRETLIRVQHVRSQKVAVIHHGFELADLNPATVDREPVRRELDVEGQTVLTSIGRYYWIKNQASLVRAFAAIAPDTPDATLVLVGGGDASELRSLIQSLGLGPRVRLLSARPDVPALLAATDLFVHPALAESFGMVIVEAMAMGCPVVSTPVGIAPEVVREGVTGELAADGSVGALASALSLALSRRDHWPEMGEAARKESQRFSAATMVESYERLYLELLGR
jgi:glycosyltransferase involved in cell wall biosynthesis